jgi:hypothetical protein
MFQVSAANPRVAVGLPAMRKLRRVPDTSVSPTTRSELQFDIEESRRQIKSVTTLKRFLIWLVESSSEAVLTGTLLLIVAHIEFRGQNLRNHRPVHDLLAMSVAVTMMFFSTGYLLTTIIGRLFLKPERKLLYPSIASTLYVIHFEILSVATGGAFEPWERWIIRVVGACIAFTCTLGGNQILSKWKPSSAVVRPA